MQRTKAALCTSDGAPSKPLPLFAGASGKTREIFGLQLPPTFACHPLKHTYSYCSQRRYSWEKFLQRRRNPADLCWALQLAKARHMIGERAVVLDQLLGGELYGGEKNSGVQLNLRHHGNHAQMQGAVHQFLAGLRNMRIATDAGCFAQSQEH